MHKRALSILYAFLLSVLLVHILYSITSRKIETVYSMFPLQIHVLECNLSQRKLRLNLRGNLRF